MRGFWLQPADWAKALVLTSATPQNLAPRKLAGAKVRAAPLRALPSPYIRRAAPPAKSILSRRSPLLLFTSQGRAFPPRRLVKCSFACADLHRRSCSSTFYLHNQNTHQPSLPRMSDVQNTVPAAATTPQQQPQGTPIQQNAPTPASVAGAGSGDQLVCQWQSCGDRLPSAEQLYVSNAPSLSHAPSRRALECFFCRTSTPPAPRRNLSDSVC